MSCIFCDIVSGKVEAKKLYEDEHVLAFYDVNPQAPVHFLVICKDHIKNVASVESGGFVVFDYIFEAIVKVARKLNLGENFRIINNCGSKAGQTVDHMHFHVLSGKALSPKLV